MRTLEKALQYTAAGISVIPVFPATHPQSPKKTTLKSWKPFQDRIATRNELESFFSNGADIAAVCGSVSGGLEIIDFDDLDVIEPFFTALALEMPHINAGLLFQKTPSGGLHIIYRWPDTEGNQKLARSEDGRVVRIETRGQGGYFLVDPSSGYEIDQDLDRVLTIARADRRRLLEVARSFDLYRPPQPSFSVPVESARPGDIFNREANWHDLLLSHGWEFLRPIGDREEWVRPGKDKKGGCSATLHPEKGLYVFSTSTILPIEQPISPFQFLTYCDFNGDFSEAARSLPRTNNVTNVTNVTSRTGGHNLSPDVTTCHKQSQEFVTNFGDITSMVNEFVEADRSSFSLTDVYQQLGAHNTAQKTAVRKALQRLKESGKILTVEGKRGVYEMVEDEFDEIDFGELDTSPLELPLPLDLHRIVGIKRGDIVLIQGESNAGKTAFMMELLRSLVTSQCLKEKKKKKELKTARTVPEKEEGKEKRSKKEKEEEKIIRYMVSEGPVELKKRLEKLGVYSLKQWQQEVSFVSRESLWHQLIIPDGFNFIDYLEIVEDHWKAAGIINQIHNKLTDGVCFIAIQKNPGRDWGIGGAQVLAKPRLVISLEGGRDKYFKMRITKAKHPIDGSNVTKPTGMMREYIISEGIRFLARHHSVWQYEMKIDSAFRKK